MAVDPATLPLRVAERAGRLMFWVMGQDLSRRERELAVWFIAEGDGLYLDTIKSYETIAKRIGVSSRTVQSAAEDLEARGFLCRERRQNAIGGHSTNRMRLTPPAELLQLRSSEPERAAIGHEGEVELADYGIGENAHSDQPGNGCEPGSATVAKPSGSSPATVAELEESGVARSATVADPMNFSNATVADEPSYNVENDSLREEVQVRKVVEGSSATVAELEESGVRPPPRPSRPPRRPARRAEGLRPAADVFGALTAQEAAQ